MPSSLSALGSPEWRTALGEAVERAPSPHRAVAGFERLLDCGGPERLAGWPAADLADLAAVLGSSNALARYLATLGDDWPAGAAAYRRGDPDAGGLRELASVGSPSPTLDLAEVGARLRGLANREMYRIGARDLLGMATLEQTLRAVTLLADVSMQIALEHARAAVATDAGDAVGADGEPIGFVVIGLGKLGGRELNYSSDIDVTYLYTGGAAAAGVPAPSAFFTRLASELTRLIGEATAEGLVFRVDLRLRPEGNGGPLVNTVANALAYYEGWGDTWERGVLAKARPIAGDLALGRRFVEGIQPFVYRRHLDFQTVEDFRTMKDRIDAEQIVRARRARNVKLGRGGIRELEFVVQVLQLIHGGHHESLRTTGTVAALDVLEQQGLIASDQAHELHEAYVFLRNVEHAVQIVEKQQTQRLPSDREDLCWLARRLGYGTGRRGKPAGVDEVAAFEADWLRHTEAVREAFVRFLELKTDEAAAHQVEDPTATALLAMIARGEDEEAAELLAEMGFPDGRRAAGNLARIYRGAFKRPASPQRRRAVESMAPALLRAVVRSADPETALDRLVDFLIRTGAHTSYLALLSGSRATMEILVTLFAASPYLTGRLIGHPELIDTLVRSDAVGARTEQELRAALDRELGACEDEEAVLAVLRRFRTAELLRIGLDDLSGTVTAQDVFARLSILADVCLTAAADVAKTLVEQRTDVCLDGVHLAVVALGKMGAREMTYGSDLDLLFIYDDGRAGAGDETHGLCTKWVQKTINLLQARTPDGIVYKIDARLRPSGRSGPLVCSFARFVDYHDKEAQLWERQAHVRARVVYGDREIAGRIDEVLARYVYGAGLDSAGVREIDRLRRRVEAEAASEGPGRRNIKTGRGGLVDIEFIAQMLQLRHGKDDPSLRRRDTAGALAALRAAGLLPADDADRLLDHYRFLRRLEARMRLERDRPVEELGTDAKGLAPLAIRLGFDGDDPGAALLATYERIRDEVRALYERYFGAGSVDV